MNNFVVPSIVFSTVQEWLIEQGTGYQWAVGYHFNDGILFNTVTIIDNDFAVRFKLVWSDHIKV